MSNAPHASEPGDIPYAKGGLILGPGGEDNILIYFHPGEQWYTAGQVRRYMAAKPGSRDALADETAPEGS